MSVASVKEYLAQWGFADKVREFAQSSATVALAAEALNVAPARIAKTLTFRHDEGCVLVVAAGDARVKNSKFKAAFATKAVMLTPEDVVAMTGHAVGGVCPFALTNPAARVYLDVSLKRFATVFPACGSANSAIEMTCTELFACAKALGWVDVCGDWEEK